MITFYHHLGTNEHLTVVVPKNQFCRYQFGNFFFSFCYLPIKVQYPVCGIFSTQPCFWLLFVYLASH